MSAADEVPADRRSRAAADLAATLAVYAHGFVSLVLNVLRAAPRRGKAQ